MGGLRHKMPWTFRTFLMGTLAIAGIPGFAGFFSKDMILEAVWHSPNYGKILWSVGLLTAGLTSFYMFRLLILTFFGKERHTHEEVHTFMNLRRQCSFLSSFWQLDPLAADI